MKRRTLFALAGIVLALPFVFLWASEDELDIRTEKILELGKEGLLFNSIDSVCEDDKHNFYVLDRKDSKVYKFSSEGQHLLSFGSSGQGPGEFQAPHDIFITEDGQVVVSEDMDTVSIFNSNGDFVKRLSAEKGLALTYLNDNLFYAWEWNEEGQTQLLVDREGTVLKRFFSVSREDFSVAAPDESGRLVMFNFATPAISPSFIFNRSQTRFVTGINNRYEFSLYDYTGAKLSTIERDIKPQKLSARERDLLLQQMQEERNWPDWIMDKIRKSLSKVKTYFEDILLSENFIFVLRIPEDITKTEGRFPVDVFDIEGDFLGPASLPAQPLHVSELYFYAAVYDEDYNLLLLKFQYTIARRPF